MHEFGIIQSIFKLLDEIALRNKLKSISKVTLQIGKLRQVVPEFLQFAFETAAVSTVAENAELVIEEVPIKLHCKSCDRDFIVERNTFICPECEGCKLEVLSGKEVLIKSVEGETPDAD